MRVGAVVSVLNASWVSTVLGIVGLVLAFYFYRKSQRRAGLSWRWSGVRLVGPHSDVGDDLAVSFRGAVVPRVVSTKITIWNSGTETIRGTDAVQQDPLIAAFATGTEVLSVAVEAATRPVNEVRAQVRSADSVVMDFDFLDPGDGAEISVIHTGEKMKPELRGTIRGMPQGWHRSDPVYDSEDLRRFGATLAAGRLPRSLPWFGLVMGALLVLAGIGDSFNAPAVARGIRWAQLVAGIFFFVAALASWGAMRSAFPRRIRRTLRDRPGDSGAVAR